MRWERKGVPTESPGTITSTLQVPPASRSQPHEAGGARTVYTGSGLPAPTSDAVRGRRSHPGRLGRRRLTALLAGPSLASSGTPDQVGALLSASLSGGPQAWTHTSAPGHTGGPSREPSQQQQAQRPLPCPRPSLVRRGGQRGVTAAAFGANTLRLPPVGGGLLLMGFRQQGRGPRGWAQECLHLIWGRG